MKNILKLILAVFLFAALVYLVFHLRTIITYVLIGGILAMLGRPIMEVLHKLKIGNYHLPRSVSAAITLSIFLLLIFGFISSFLPLIIQEAKVIASLDYGRFIEGMEYRMREVNNFLYRHNLIESTTIIENGAENGGKESETFEALSLILRETLVPFFNQISWSNVLVTFLGLFGNIFNILASLFSVCFITFFLLKDRELFYNFALNFVPFSLEKSYEKVVSTTSHLLTRYFTGVFLQITLIACLVTIGMLIFDIKYALLIGFFAGVINIIPYIGPMIGMAFGLFVGITTNVVEQDFYVKLAPLILQISSVFLAVQFLDNILFHPVIFSSSIRAHPLEIFLVISVGYTFAGIGGMILAIPCYTILRVIAQELLIEFKLLQSER